MSLPNSNQISNGLKKLAFQGLKWSFMQQIAILCINYTTLLILAYLIEPKYHGIIVLASIPTGLTGVLGTMGVREKILADNNIPKDKMGSLLGLVVIISVFLTFITILVSLCVSIFYGKQYSFSLLFKLCLSLILITPLGVFNNFFEGLQSRNLQFKKQNILSIAGISIGSAFSIPLAYFSMPFISLASKLLLPHVIIFLGYLLIIRVDFKLKWSKTVLSEMKSFLSYFSTNAIFNYLVRNIDYIIIGRYFAPEVLGQYSIAYKILLFPMKTITSRVNAVLLPVLSKLNQESLTFKKKYFLVINVLSFIIFPLMGFLSITSHTWVPLFFNNNYTLLSDMVMVLAIVGMFQALVSPVGTLFLLKENLRAMLRNSIFASIVVTFCYLLSSLLLDIHGVIIVFALTWVFFLMPITLYAAFRPYKYNMRDFLKALFPSLLSLFLSGSVSFMLMEIWHGSKVMILLIVTCVFMLIYITSYHVLTKKSENNLSYLLSLARP